MLEILLALLLFVFGLGVLVKGSDYLVEGASSFALALRITPMVIGLTVVAFGTSAPELLVSVTSALRGSADLALGNVIGSNIANILLILGVAALIRPVHIKSDTIWKEVPMSFLGAILMVILGLQTYIDWSLLSRVDVFEANNLGQISRSNGLILLCFFIIFMYYSFGAAKKEKTKGPQIYQHSRRTSIIYMTLGVIGLALGSQLVVENAITIASTLGVSDALIGLTLIAVGTSVPELATAITAARRGQNDLVVGNIVGSNIFNIFFVLAVTSVILPIPLKGTQVLDIMILLVATIFLYVTFFIRKRHQLGKAEGTMLLLFYAGYIAFVLYRG
jgi:cation:H+ antiporter